MKTTAVWTCVAMAVQVLGVSAGTWTFKSPRVWSRAKDAATLTTRVDGTLELRHTGDQDWSIHGSTGIAVKPGDVFRLSCESEALADVSKSQPYTLSAILLDENGKVMSWCYGTRSAQPGRPIVSEFMIPPRGARIEPRVVGGGPTGVAVKNFKVESLGNRLPLCANVHLSGSMANVVAYAAGILAMFGDPISIGPFTEYILAMSIVAVASPGVPGGCVLAAGAFVDSALGFTPERYALMVAIYMALDGMGTACNLTGDGAIAMMVDRLADRKV